MIAIDANILSLILYPEASVPDDYRTKQPIPMAHRRAEQLIEQASARNEAVLIAAPILAEVLVVVADKIEEYITEFEQSATLRIKPFGTRAAVELAIRTKAARDSGDKKDGVQDTWAKVKYDRQLMAIAKVEGAMEVFSTDAGVLKHAAAFGLVGRHLADVELKPRQSELFDNASPESTPEEEGTP